MELKLSILKLCVFYIDCIGKMNLFTARVVLTSICLRSLFYYCNTKRIKTIIITLEKLQFYFNSTTRRSRTLFELKDSCSYSVKLSQQSHCDEPFYTNTFLELLNKDYTVLKYHNTLTVLDFLTHYSRTINKLISPIITTFTIMDFKAVEI